ncbi:MAG: lysophospholipid acyltransferase family protein [Chloroflexota bacterium]
MMNVRNYPISFQLIFESLAAIGLGMLLIGTLERSTIPLFNWFGIYLIIVKLIELLGFAYKRKFPSTLFLFQDIAVLIIGIILSQFDENALIILADVSNFLIDLRITIVMIASTILLIALMGFVQTARGGGWGGAIVGILCLVFGISTLNVDSFALERLFDGLGVAAVIAGVLGLLAAFFDRYDGMSPVVAIFRLIGILLIVLRTLGFAFVGWLVPFRWRGLRTHYWIIQQMSQTLLQILNIEVICEDKETIQQHEGIIFVNHLSYLDILILLAVTPGRFLSTAELFTVPLVGLTAESINTVFVERNDKNQRSDVRQLIADSVNQNAYPPFFIFPEGRFGDPDKVRPFRYGAFEIAAQNEIPYLLCALGFSPVDVMRWHGKKEESFAQAIWRLLRYRQPMKAKLKPLQTIYPSSEADHRQLAQQAETITNATLPLL